jgi:plastocyanin
MRTLITLGMVALGTMASSCGDDTGAPPVQLDLSGVVRDMATAPGAEAGTTTAPMTAAVDVIDNAYAPMSVTIAKGGTVTWTWRGANPHTVTSNTNEPFDSSPPKVTGTFSHTFNTAGTFPYHCTVHLFMGTVIVQ